MYTRTLSYSCTLMNVMYLPIESNGIITLSAHVIHSHGEIQLKCSCHRFGHFLIFRSCEASCVSKYEWLK
jgi:hypothetical protein